MDEQIKTQPIKDKDIGPICFSRNYEYAFYSVFPSGAQVAASSPIYAKMNNTHLFDVSCGSYHGWPWDYIDRLQAI